MEATTKEINWLEEAKRLKESQEFERYNWWKPEEGRYSIEILNNGEPFDVVLGSEDEPKIVHKVRLEIKINGSEETKNWGITKGKTVRGLFGQLCTVAKKNGGHLKGARITLLVKGSGRNKDYTVLEAIENSNSEKKENIPSADTNFAKGILNYLQLCKKSMTKQDLYRIFDIPPDRIDRAIEILENENKLVVELDGTLVVL